jgi:DNA-binding Lrp family transcriptional regulator
VIDALQQHSKDNIDAIAKHCRFSRQKVWRIVKNLEKNKVIWGYSPITENNGDGVLCYDGNVPKIKWMQKSSPQL